MLDNLLNNTSNSDSAFLSDQHEKTEFPSVDLFIDYFDPNCF